MPTSFPHTPPHYCELQPRLQTAPALTLPNSPLITTTFQGTLQPASLFGSKVCFELPWPSSLTPYGYVTGSVPYCSKNIPSCTWILKPHFGLNEQIDETNVTVIINRAKYNFKVVIHPVSGGCYFELCSFCLLVFSDVLVIKEVLLLSLKKKKGNFILKKKNVKGFGVFKSRGNLLSLW